MTRFDTIIVGNDFVSEHWLVEEFPAKVKKQRAVWKEREDYGKPTPREGLTDLSRSFGRDLVRFRETDDVERLRALHAAVRAALRFDGEELAWTSERAGGEMTVPAVVGTSPTGTHLLVLQARDAVAVEDLVDDTADGAGHLLRPAVVDGDEVSATTTVLSGVFRAEDPPELVLITAGAWVLVAERGTWPEGRWLAVDLATALERRDTKAAGELETIAALVSADALLPGDDGAAPLLDLLQDSVKHAEGVSKDLREGVRESVELIASEILRRRARRGLPDDAPDLASDLTRQSLRFLYRILFLLYAEARPELGVLPVGAPEYGEGYGLDRFRELVLTELTSSTAQDGRHLFESLAVLFRLVNDGHALTGGPDEAADDAGGLRFEALRADLFEPSATPLIDEVGLGNACLQQVLSRLLLSKKGKKGQDRGFVSYAQLGINQLGAVYEGLMSYSGSVAREEMYEVAKDRDPSKGSWVVPIALTEDYDDDWFVEDIDEDTNDRTRRMYRPGDFVFRLSGRERQRSASYYTPEVLTRCVVKHSLAELLNDDTRARDILDLTICEPALGSGAFLIEAINQLADEYLRRRQWELRRDGAEDCEIPPERFADEKQKVKAYLALHQCYGVDLNATAVELAEITVWLDAMHPGLKAPWFGLHLRRGNSLIGARREVYTPDEVAKRGWLRTVPTARALGTPVEPTAIHHFLLPAAGWGAAADTRETKEGRPRAVSVLKAWRKSITSTLSKDELVRLQALARRVEVLWSIAEQRLRVAEDEIRREVRVWGVDSLPVGSGAVPRETIEKSLSDSNSVYRRLRLVMDAWAALWFWPIDADLDPPTRKQWLESLEALLGTMSKAEATSGRGMFADHATWSELDDIEANERTFSQMQRTGRVLADNPWLSVCIGISATEGFFHWELDFAPVFASRAGFDLQIGNPPWVRPEWDDGLALAEHDPWFALAEKPSPAIWESRRADVLDINDETYVGERCSAAGTISHLGSAQDRPSLSGLRPDLYRCFMDRCWRTMREGGVVGLIHPESHFSESRAGALRRQTYRRLRRHWQFRNEFKFFDIINTRTYGISIYGSPQAANFISAVSLYHPNTIDRSFDHDGTGPEPGVKDDNDDFDVRPHANRLVEVDKDVLARWAALIDEPSTPPIEARLLRPVTTSSQRVIDKLAKAPRFDRVFSAWTSGWDETADRDKGYFSRGSAIPHELSDVIYQGPHLGVANPFYQNPIRAYKTFKDYRLVDTETVEALARPRTNYQRSRETHDFVSGYPTLKGRPWSHYWRLLWRSFVDASTERTLQAALVPPGPTHVHGVFATTLDDLSELAVAAGVWSSLLADYLVKISVASAINESVVRRLPHPVDDVLRSPLLLRTLRLNCLTADYADLWSGLFEPSWRRDTWTRTMPTGPVGEVSPNWTVTTPLRKSAERRQALVEIDALVAVMLGVTAQELCAIYRTQFGVLRKYERIMQFDVNGREVSKDVLKAHEKYGARSDLGRYELPFASVDREREMTVAHEEFTRRLADRTPASAVTAQREDT